jgi:starch synthase
MALLVCVSRLEPQKGMSLFESAREALMSRNVALVIASTGTRRYTELARRMVELFPGRVAFSEETTASPLVHQVIAASDMILLPSEYEPCGLWQFVALHYGTLPLARRTGGLADSIEDEITGFLFNEYRDSAFLAALDRALAAFSQHDVWEKMQRAAMHQDWSWTHSASQYISIYRELVVNQK